MTAALVPEAQNPIQLAILSLEHDAGALYAADVLKQLRAMRGKDPAAFARLRIQVKETKRLSMVEFDKLTASSNDDIAPDNGIFAEVEPWPDPVDGADLLDDVTHALARHGGCAEFCVTGVGVTAAAAGLRS